MDTKKIALVTGATSGIGLETAKGLIENGFLVIATSRSKEKQERAKKYLGKEVEFITAELSMQESLRKLNEDVTNILDGRGLDALVNNAGAFSTYFSLTDEGVEKQFAVNTIAPFYNSLLFYDKLIKVGGRVINVSSSSHYRTKIKWNDMQLTRNYHQLQAYKQTKLMSVMLSKKFNEVSEKVKTYMADPGLVNTDMGFKETSGIAKLVWKYRKRSGQPPRKGAETSIYLSCADELCGFYFKDCVEQMPNKKAFNEDSVNKVWEYCQKVLNITAEEWIKSYENG